MGDRVGWESWESSSATANGAETERIDAIASRYRGNSAGDQSFGTNGNGVTRIDAAALDDRFRDVVVLHDGRILAVGSSRESTTGVDALGVLLDPDGTPVDHYGDGGFLRAPSWAASMRGSASRSPTTTTSTPTSRAPTSAERD